MYQSEFGKDALLLLPHNTDLCQGNRYMYLKSTFCLPSRPGATALTILRSWEIMVGHVG
jgi:hypothetical protein